jgi:hypothetical protein
MRAWLLVAFGGAVGSMARYGLGLMVAALVGQAFPWGTLLINVLGSLVIGLLTRERGYAAFKPLCTDLFSGVLVFFLLDLGLVSARRLRSVFGRGLFLPAFGLLLPPIAAGVAYPMALKSVGLMNPVGW